MDAWRAAGIVRSQVLIACVCAVAAAAEGERARVTSLERAPERALPGSRIGGGSHTFPAISADGRFVVFASASPYLIDGAEGSVFLHDRLTGSLSVVSMDSAGRAVPGSSFAQCVSSDGRFVAFTSWVETLPLSNGLRQVYVLDRTTGAVTCASAKSSGTSGNGDSGDAAISADGNVVAFTSYATNFVPRELGSLRNVYLYDRTTRTLTHVSVGPGGAAADGNSGRPCLSADGRYLVFESAARNLVAGDSNDSADVFLFDRIAGTLTRISTTSSGAQAQAGAWQPGISGDGRTAAFCAAADSMGLTGLSVLVFAKNLRTGELAVASVPPPSPPQWVWYETGAPRLDHDGTHLVYHLFPHNLEGLSPIGVVHRDLTTGDTATVCAESFGDAREPSWAPSVSADGRSVAYVAQGSGAGADLCDAQGICVRDMPGGAASLVTKSTPSEAPNGAGFSPSLSGDGRLVAFASRASNLVADDRNCAEDVFILDRAAKRVIRASVASDGTEGNGLSESPAISLDGKCVAFVSEATNLVRGDANGARDVFVHDCLTRATTRVSVTSDGGEAHGSFFVPAVSGDGSRVVFWSDASDLVPGDTNRAADIFLHDRATGATRRVNVGPHGEEEPSGAEGRPCISANGRFVSFTSRGVVLGAPWGMSAGKFLQLFRGDTETGELTLVSVAPDGTPADEGVYLHAMTADATTFAFCTAAQNLFPPWKASGCFVRNAATGAIACATLDYDGFPAGSAGSVAISADGRFVAFGSYDAKFVAEDANGRCDVFLRDTALGYTLRVSAALDGEEGNADSAQRPDEIALSADGTCLAFPSLATNRVAAGGWRWEPQVYAATLDIPFPRGLRIRGDTNGDTKLNLADPIALLAYLFGGAPAPACLPAANASGNGRLDIADAVFLLSYLFGTGSAPPGPFPACEEFQGRQCFDACPGGAR